MSAASGSEPKATPLKPGGWLRILGRVLATLVWLIFCLTAYLVWHFLVARNPWPRRFLQGFTWIAGLKIAAEGRRPLGGEFLLANHVSWLDIPLLGAVTGTAFVANDGLAENRFARWICGLNDTVFVARHRRSGVKDQVEDIRRALNDTGALAVFPEGTTGDGSELLPFKSSLLGALQPFPNGIAVQPVAIDYGTDTKAIAWVGDEPALTNIVRVLARRQPLCARIQFLPPLSGEELADRKSMSLGARAAIARALDVTPNG